MKLSFSFLTLLALLLFVGKIGHIGTLGGLHWAAIAGPLALDITLEILRRMGYTLYLVKWLELEGLKRTIKSNAKKIKKEL